MRSVACECESNSKATQRENFLVLMENYSRSVKLTEDSLSSLGTAEEKYVAYSDGVEASQKRLTAEFERMVLLINESGVIKGVYDLSAALLKLGVDSSSLASSLSLIMTLAMMFRGDSILKGISGFFKMVSSDTKTLNTAMSMLPQVFREVKAGTMSVGDAMKALSIGTSAAALALTGLFAILTIGLMVYNKEQQKKREQLELTKQNLAAFKEESSVRATLLAQINNEATDRAGLLSVLSNYNAAYYDEVSAITDVNKAREKAIQLIYEEQIAKANEMKMSGSSQKAAYESFLTDRNYQVYAEYEKKVERVTAGYKLKTLESTIKELQSIPYEKLSKFQQDLLRRSERDWSSLNKQVSEAKAYINDYNEALEIAGMTVDDFMKKFGSSSSGSSNNDSGSGFIPQGDAKDEIQKYLDSVRAEFEAHFKDLQYLRDMDIISEAEYYERLSQLNDLYFKDKKDLLDDYRKYEVEIYKYLKDQRKQELEDEIAAVEKRKSNLEKAVSYVNWLADKEIEKLQKQKDALGELNDERKDAIELEKLEMALAEAKARRVRVYREGKGFVYEQDVIAVNEAQKNLDEYKAQKRHEAEIKRIDDQIKKWQDYKKAWADVVSDYEAEQNKLIFLQIFGKNAEQDILNQRISIVKEFADMYSSIMADLTAKRAALDEFLSRPLPSADKGYTLGNGKTAITNETNGSSPSGNKTNTGGSSGSSSGGFVLGGNNNSSAKEQAAKQGHNSAGGVSNAEQKKLADAQKAKTGGGGGGSNTYSMYAGGTLGTTENEWAMTGEEGRELMHLQKGTAVFPNKATENLMDFGSNPMSFISSLFPKGSSNFSDGGISYNYNLSGITVMANSVDEFMSEINRVFKSSAQMAITKRV